MMEKIKLLLVDDHHVVRSGIKYLLEKIPGYEIVGEASNGKKALEMLKENTVDIVLMDINMPVMDGIECTRHIINQYPDIKVIALTMLIEHNHIKKMISAGANGYLVKNAGEDEIKLAINTVLDDREYYSPEVTEVVMNKLTNRPTKRQSWYDNQVPLTVREKEIYALVIQALSNQEISEKLFISIRTVEAHKRNLIEKTGTKNIVGLVKFALENNLFNDV